MLPNSYGCKRIQWPQFFSQVNVGFNVGVGNSFFRMDQREHQHNGAKCMELLSSAVQVGLRLLRLVRLVKVTRLLYILVEQT